MKHDNKYIMYTIILILLTGTVTALDGYNLLYNFTFETDQTNITNFTTSGGTFSIHSGAECKVSNCLQQEVATGQPSRAIINDSYFDITGDTTYYVQGWIRDGNVDQNPGAWPSVGTYDATLANGQTYGFAAQDDEGTGSWVYFQNDTIKAGVRTGSYTNFTNLATDYGNTWIWLTVNVSTSRVEMGAYTDQTLATPIMRQSNLTPAPTNYGYVAFYSFRDAFWDNIEFYTPTTITTTLPTIIQRNITSETGISNTSWPTRYNLTDTTPTIALTLDSAATGLRMWTTEANYSQSGSGVNCTGATTSWTCTQPTSLPAGNSTLYFTLQTAVNESYTPLPNTSKINVYVKPTPDVNITLNQAVQNVTVNWNAQVNITCMTNNTDTSGNMTLYRNNVFLATTTTSPFTIHYKDNLTTVNTYRYNCTMNATTMFASATSITITANATDTTAPNVNLNHPPDGSLTNQPINFTWTATDDYYASTNCTLYINGTANTSIISINNTATNYTLNFTTEGTRWWNVTCQDNSTNTGTSTTRNFTIDRTPPVLSNIIIIPTDPIYSPIGTVNTSITATDTHNITVTLQLDNGTILTLNTTDQLTYNYSYTGITSGYHNFTWTATDIAGNTATNTTIRFVGNFNISDCSNTTTHPYTPINASIKLASTLLPVISNSVINLQAYYQTPTNYQNYSFTFTNTANWTLCQNTNETLQVTGTITYQDTNATYAQNTYTWTNADFNANTQQLSLYLFPATTPIVITVLDEFGNPVSDATVQVLTTIGGLTYSIVSTLTTGYDGKTVGNLVGYTQWYKFNVIKGGTTLLATSPILITSTTLTLNLPSTNSWITAYDNFQNTLCTVAYNNATSNMRLDWINTEGNVIHACLEITRDDILHTGVSVNTTCTDSASGTILIPVNTTATSKSLYIGTGKITANLTTFQCGTPVSVESDGSTWKTYNTEGISYAFIIVLTMFAIGIWNPVVSVLLGMVGLIVVNLMGFYVMSIPVLVGIIIIMGVAMWRLRQK